MTRQVEHLVELQKEIELKHQCIPAHRETVFVHEKTNGNETVWKGHVEVFDLTSHNEAKTCYAWRHSDAGGLKIFTVLGSHVVNSAQRAIQAAIFVNAQPATQKFNDLELLKKRIERAKKTLQDTEIKVEDLDAIIQSSIENRDKRRRPAN